MAYTDIDDPTAFFQAKTYTGTGSSNAVTYDGNSDMQPDWLLFKNRQTSLNWMMWDSVRGITKYFYSNLNEAEGSTSTVLTAIGSDGFTVGNNNNVNKANENIGHWGWKAGTSFSNDASSTSVGSIDSVGSVNTDAGFSIQTWTGSGSAATLAHGLGVVPKMIIVKNRTDAVNWFVYHHSAITAGGSNKSFLTLNETGAVAANGTATTFTSVSSTTFGVGTDNIINGDSDSMIAYLFAEKQGYSKFGTYTGNGNADGTYVYTGFKPAFVICKRAVGGTGNWGMNDTKRDPFNGTSHTCDANNTEDADDVAIRMDILSSGFKLKTDSSNWNASGSTYIFMCFASNPYVTSSGIPTTAR